MSSSPSQLPTSQALSSSVGRPGQAASERGPAAHQSSSESGDGAASRGDGEYGWSTRQERSPAAVGGESKSAAAEDASVPATVGDPGGGTSAQNQNQNQPSAAAAAPPPNPSPSPFASSAPAAASWLPAVRPRRPLLGLFFSEFDNRTGRTVPLMVPERVVSLEAVDLVGDYIITKPQLCGRVITVRAAEASLDAVLVGYPVCLEHDRFDRNAYWFNLVFVLASDAACGVFVPVVRSCGQQLVMLEQEGCFLLQHANRPRP